MQHAGKTLRLKVDAYTRFCLTAIVVLMTVMILGLWAERTPTADRAAAAERYQPKSTTEIGELVRVQERTIDKLEEIRKLLESGDVKVQVTEAPGKDVGGGSNVQPSPSAGEDTSIVPSGVHVN